MKHGSSCNVLSLFVNLDLPDPHLFAGYNRHPVASTALTVTKQGRKRRLGTAIQAPATAGYPDDVDHGTLQQGALTAGLKTELYSIRHHTAQFTDLYIDREHPPAARMALADFDDTLGYGHFMHGKLPGRSLDKKKPAGNPAGFSYQYRFRN
jgi:hypothetical protein